MVVDTDLIGSDQENIGTPRGCSLCRCGESRNKPLCDGSHAQVGFDGEREDTDKRELEFSVKKKSQLSVIATYVWVQDTVENSKPFSAPTMRQNMNRMLPLSRKSLRPLKNVPPAH